MAGREWNGVPQLCGKHYGHDWRRWVWKPITFGVPGSLAPNTEEVHASWTAERGIWPVSVFIWIRLVIWDNFSVMAFGIPYGMVEGQNEADILVNTGYISPT